MWAIVTQEHGEPEFGVILHAYGPYATEDEAVRAAGADERILGYNPDWWDASRGGRARIDGEYLNAWLVEMETTTAHL